MPEQHQDARWQQPWTLVNAQNVGQVARIRCGRCNIKRHYKPAELREVVGNISADAVAQKMRCDVCKRGDYMSCEFFNPTGPELEAIQFRRLVEIRFERRIIWRDET